MNIQQARASVGGLVMSFDAEPKLIARVTKAHGPYRLIQVTKGGLAILEDREDDRINPSLLEPYDMKPGWYLPDAMVAGIVEGLIKDVENSLVQT